MPIGEKNTVIPGCGAHHVSIQARNWEASLHLYRDVLGMKVVGKFGTEERPMAMLDMGDGSHIELIGLKNDASTREEMPVAEPGLENPILHLALTTTDTRAAVELVRQAGFKITIEPRDVDLGELKVTIAFFKGPNGELIEFFQTH